MKTTHRPFQLILSLLVAILVLSGCAPRKPSGAAQLAAINKIRQVLELPALPLQIVETTYNANSPSGDLQVVVYADSQGRKFSVDPQTNRVVEIDARALLASIPADAPSVSQDILRTKARKFIAATTPHFASLEAGLKYEESGKIDNSFFDWTDTQHPGSSNRTFAQIGFHKSGLLFAYYNTLSLK